MEEQRKPHIVGMITGEITQELGEEHVALYYTDKEFIYSRLLTWRALHALLLSPDKEKACAEQARELKNIPIEVLQRVTREQVHLHLLINSSGGSIAATQRIKQIIDTIHQQSGKSIAYGTNYICSAAADIFGHATERYALRDSTFLFHGTSDKFFDATLEKHLGEKLQTKIREERKKEMLAYKRMILSQVKSTNKKRVKWAFDIAMNNPENRLLDTFFRGEDLKGFVKTAFAHRRDLWNAFVREFDIPTDFAKTFLEKLRPFFQRIDIQQSQTVDEISDE